MQKMEMPEIDVSAVVGPDEREIAERVVNNGRLRATKPPVSKDVPLTGRAAYVWRMTAFFVSPKPKHQCMPVCCDFDLCRLDWDNRKVVTPLLDKIVDALVSSVPLMQQHGVIRWGQALGRIGTPRHNEEGAVIYR